MFGIATEPGLLAGGLLLGGHWNFRPFRRIYKFIRSPTAGTPRPIAFSSISTKIPVEKLNPHKSPVRPNTNMATSSTGDSLTLLPVFGYCFVRKEVAGE